MSILSRMEILVGADSPDSIVWATARCEGCLLVTRNSKDFPPTEPGVRIPYVV